ncbi:uncharacterized protein LOC105427302 isoform X2 [Pogonomyrmex barbatus]|uniref:Uncharacterized protein LOC105427302 isoform X2 n=1 Tax=Pogonomyrmex barbatus TaxID=144034 RepID=A0A6I9W5K8_9HYME|nr:uncharacterized protein LOC105427302 isoform X2 [Pogonomyrmex barbatus]
MKHQLEVPETATAAHGRCERTAATLIPTPSPTKVWPVPCFLTWGSCNNRTSSRFSATS